MGITLKHGEYYFIGVWDFKGPDASEDLINRQFGLIEDYPQMKTGSSIEIRGPAMAKDDGGSPDPDHFTHTWLESSTNRLSEGYGPLNMIYTSTESSLTPYTATLGSHSNAFTGYVGVQIKTGDKPVMLTHVGRYRITSPANAHTHQVVILKKALGACDATSTPTEVIASAMVDASQAAESDGYNYTKLQNPVVLEPNTYYVVASYEKAGDDHYITGGTIQATNSIFWDSTAIICSYGIPSNGMLVPIALTPVVNLKAQ